MARRRVSVAALLLLMALSCDSELQAAATAGTSGSGAEKDAEIGLLRAQMAILSQKVTELETVEHQQQDELQHQHQVQLELQHENDLAREAMSGQGLLQTQAEVQTGNNSSCLITDYLYSYLPQSAGVGDNERPFKEMLCKQQPLNKNWTLWSGWLTTAKCPTTCECVTDCRTECPGYSLQAADMAVCMNASVWDDEKTYCKGVLNEMQQMLMQIQGLVAVYQSLTVMFVTRYKAFFAPNLPMTLLISEQVLRSSFVLMGVTGGTLGIVRSSYMYAMYSCENELTMTRYMARYTVQTYMIVAFTFITLLLLLDRILQGRMVWHNIRSDTSLVLYKLKRLLTLSKDYRQDHQGATELMLWDDLFDRMVPAREFIDQSTRIFLFRKLGGISHNFQLLDCYAILFLAYITQHLIYTFFMMDDPRTKWYLPKRSEFGIVIGTSCIVVVLVTLYLGRKILRSDRPAFLKKMYLDTCSRHVPHPFTEDRSHDCEEYCIKNECNTKWVYCIDTPDDECSLAPIECPTRCSHCPNFVNNRAAVNAQSDAAAPPAAATAALPEENPTKSLDEAESDADGKENANEDLEENAEQPKGSKDLNFVQKIFRPQFDSKEGSTAGGLKFNAEEHHAAGAFGAVSIMLETDSILAEPGVAKWTPAPVGSESFCLKWLLCIDKDSDRLHTRYVYDPKRPDKYLEKYATCWMLAEANPQPSELMRIPKVKTDMKFSDAKMRAHEATGKWGSASIFQATKDFALRQVDRDKDM